jgi:hypothetical protein
VTEDAGPEAVAEPFGVEERLTQDKSVDVKPLTIRGDRSQPPVGGVMLPYLAARRAGDNRIVRTRIFRAPQAGNWWLDLAAQLGEESALIAGDSNFRQGLDLKLVKVVRRR